MDSCCNFISLVPDLVFSNILSDIREFRVCNFFELASRRYGYDQKEKERKKK